MSDRKLRILLVVAVAVQGFALLLYAVQRL
jgi:hypothetical protein